MLDRTLRWRPLDGAGLEHCEVRETPEAITVRSVVIGDHDGQLFGARYQLQLDPDWTFRTLHLERTDGAAVTLQSDGRGHWIDGENHHLAELDGCIDIDLSGSPLTNTLPIRRARLESGMPQRFDMAWIPLDTLRPLRDGQIYTWLGGSDYRYQAADRSFEAVLSVDADSFVAHYPGLFAQLLP
jgi:uncharacterized protein